MDNELARNFPKTGWRASPSRFRESVSYRDHTSQSPKRQEIVGLTPDERQEIAGEAYDMISRLENEANDGE